MRHYMYLHDATVSTHPPVFTMLHFGHILAPYHIPAARAALVWPMPTYETAFASGSFSLQTPKGFSLWVARSGLKDTSAGGKKTPGIRVIFRYI